LVGIFSFIFCLFSIFLILLFSENLLVGVVLCPNTPMQIAFLGAVMDLSTLENEFTQEGMLSAPINGSL
jgi:hypothetical protein